MRHPYFNKAVMQAYEKLLPRETFPSYFLFLDLDPAAIDINVHPTKTEIKFENDVAIWQIVHAAVRESLGKHNVVPSIDFDQSGSIDIPVPGKEKGTGAFPEIPTDPHYNPFETEKHFPSGSHQKRDFENRDLRHWEDLYSGTGNQDEQTRFRFDKQEKNQIEATERYSGKKVLQFKQKYILTPVKSGLMVIDQKRAHERILFEKFMEVLKSDAVASQQQLFPQTIELEAGDSVLLKSILDDLLSLGFDIREFGKNTFVINGTPGVLDVASPEIIVEKLLEEYKNSPVDARAKAKEQVAISLAKASALDYGTNLEQEEIDHLIDNLFACSTPHFSPEGKKVLTIQSLENFEKMFQK